MRKILPSILIFLIIASIFAPFSVGVNQNKSVTIHKSVASADLDPEWENAMAKLKADLEKANAAWEAAKKDGNQALIDKAKAYVDRLNAEIKQLEALNKQWGFSDPMPGCGLGLVSGSITGCVAQLIYYVLFVPTSYVFALCGQFFDYTFHYSVSDTSYRSPFVVEGWKLVRDFCNIFFIFVLLYIAFSTILGLGHSKPKEMIINVVIIGLLINFSLFAAQVIVDTSNILARVFYNSDSIKVTRGFANCVTTSDPSCSIAQDLVPSSVTATGPNGEIPLSEAIVSKVNPQELIINSRRVSDIKDKVNNSSFTTSSGGSVGAGAFILITLLAVVVNIVGIIVFFSVGMIFVSRVIGIWLSMVLAPLAFFSYMVPQMQSIAMIGWKKWWPELISMAFLAPIFIFFMYLIIKFLEVGFNITKAVDLSGMAFVVSIIVPFAFLMVLLMKAKDIAKKMSGEVGQGITGGIATIGGLALGGAAIGGAVLGKKVIANTTARASQGKTLSQRYVDPTEYAKMSKIQKFVGGFGSGIGLHKVFGNKKDAEGRVSNGLGGVLNRKQEKVEKVDRARHEIDTVKDKHYKDVEWNKLSGVQQNNVKKDYIKENKSKYASDVEEEYKISKGIKKGDNLDPTQRAEVTKLTEEKAAGEFDKALTEATKAIGGFTRAFTRTNTGTYDVRNLSQTKADKREGFMTKMSAGLIAGIALGVRTGLKTSGINHGSGQNDVMKDLGHTITEALKSIKVDVKVEESKGKGGGDAHKSGGH